MTTPRPATLSSHRLPRILLWLVLAAALYLRLEGIRWPPYHPDEPVIAAWLRHGEPDRAYPGGFFTLAQPLRWAWEQWVDMQHRFVLFQNPSADPARPQPDYLLMARYINVLLGVLTCLAIYLAAKALTDSRAYAVLSAALLAFSQYHIEHSHYAETDIAMIFVLAVALALWLYFVRAQKVFWFFAAAFAMGFAGGTKFTLVTLWPAVLIFPIIGKKPDNFSNVWKWRLFGPFAAALLLAAGFAVATPAIFDWREFWAGVAAEAGRVYRETRLNMGPLADDAAVRLAARLHDFAVWSASLGLPWIILWAISIPVLFAPGSRRAWIALVVGPACYLAYWIFQSPWVRTQEYMVFLPFAALTAPWAAFYLWRNGQTTARAVAVLACTAACVGAASQGVRTASIFGWPDTRDLATRWLALCAPANTTYAAEKYAIASPPNGTAVPIRMVAHHEVSSLKQRGIDYVFRNGAQGDRGMVHPITGQRYPEFERAYSQFVAQSERLRVFGLLPPQETLTTFNSIRLEIYGLHRYAQWPTVTHPLPQPAYIARGERWTYFPIGRHLGPATVVELTPDETQCAVAGPDEPTSPVYAIVYTRERPAIVRLKGFGRRWTLRLAPYDARLIPLVRPVWRPRWAHIERISARVVPQRNVYRVPCYLQLAFSRAEARRILHDLNMTPSPDFGLGPDTQVNLRHIQRLENLVRLADTEFGVGPNSAWYYNQFARLRATNNIAVEWFEENSGSEASARARIVFPILRSVAPATLTFDAVIVRGEVPRGVKTRIAFYEEMSGTPLAETNVILGTTNNITLSLPTGRAGELALTAEMEEPLLERIERAELRWDIHSVLRHESAELRLALAEQHVRQGRPDEALDVLAPLSADLSLEQELRRRRMLWDVWASKNAAGAREAAHKLLELAPCHLGAIESLGTNDSEKAAILEGIRKVAELDQPVRFHRFLILRAAEADVERGELRMLFESTEDWPPPLVARLYTRRHGRWKAPGPDHAAKIRPRAKGEWLAVTLPLPDFPPPDRVAFAIESDVRWHPGRLPAEGFADGIVPISELRRAAQRE